ncbi:MAG: alcohol dehydrogenase [Caldilineae bacterium]|nr:MAG: alcohol dehydrogenase [Caldilineae bacterium]
MLALLLQNGHLRLETSYPRPIPRQDEALIRVRLAGICGTDLALVEGYKGGYNGVPGHEYVGEVVEAPGNEEWVGRRVVGEINTACGQCDRCTQGLVTHCRERRVLGIKDWDGAFAEYLVSPLSLLHRPPPTVPDTSAVFTEPLAAAYAALRDMPDDLRQRPPATLRILIVGDGRLGQLLARVFQAEGYRPLLLGRHPSKLALARSCGIATTRQIDTSAEYDIAVDASGRPETLATLLGHVRPRGAIILKTTAAHPASLDLAPLVVNEIRLIGSRCGPFPRALTALEQTQIDPRPLISATYPLSAALEAMEHARRPDAIKVLLQP